MGVLEEFFLVLKILVLQYEDACGRSETEAQRLYLIVYLAIVDAPPLVARIRECESRLSKLDQWFPARLENQIFKEEQIAENLKEFEELMEALDNLIKDA